MTAISEGHVCSSKKDEPLLRKFLVVRLYLFLVYKISVCTEQVNIFAIQILSLGLAYVVTYSYLLWPIYL